MAKPSPIPDRRASSSCGLFSCCFGSFQEEDMNRPDGRRRNRWLHRKSAAKTVPVVDHLNLSGKPNSADKTEPAPSKSKSKSKSSVKLQSSKSIAENLTGKRQAPFRSRKPPDQKTPKHQTKNGPAQNTVADPDSANDTAGQKRRSFCRKIDSIRTGSISQPGSPVVRSGAEEMDPVVGMSIILVTLIIMLVWGRVCAILSTSAWFYFIPRLRKSAKLWSNRDDDSILDDGDLSYEYKKRVVLEGFLERTRRGSH